MKLVGNGGFLGQEEKTRTKDNTKYTLVRFGDDNGKPFELMSVAPLMGFNQYEKCEFVCEIVQGQYTSYKLVDVKRFEAKKVV